MIGYKVVRLRDAHRVSLLVPIKGAETEYLPDCFVEPHPNNGPLCVFYGLDESLVWSTKGGKLERWVVEYKPSQFTDVWFGQNRVGLVHLPSGTALADQVKLIRKL